jgi:ABC-2 type transport system permease protein
MRKILQIALNDLRVIFADRSIYLNLILIPIGLALAVGYANGAGSSGSASPTRELVDLIDADNSATSKQFAESLRALLPDARLCPLDNTADDACGLNGATLDAALAETRLKAKTSAAMLAIPAGFGAQLMSGANASVVYRSDEDANAPSARLEAVQTAAQHVGGSIAAAKIGTDALASLPALSADKARLTETINQKAAALWAQNPVAVKTVESAMSVSEQSANTGFSQSFPGMASMYVMFAVFPAMAAFMEERRNWTLQRLITMPLRRSEVLGGKLLARFVMGMIQFAIMFGFGLLIGVRFGGSALGIIVVMAAYTACITALALALTTLLKNGGQARGLTLFLTLTLAPLGGAWWPLEIVPGWMQTVGHISPLAWAMDGFNMLIFHGGGLGALLLPVGVLIAAAVALFAFGVARFQYE